MARKSRKPKKKRANFWSPGGQRGKAGEADPVLEAIRVHQKGDLGRAEKMYARILNKHPDHPDALHNLGVLALQSGKLDRAVELMRKSVEGNPQSAFYYQNLGTALFHRGDVEAAAACWRRGVELDPNDADLRNKLGVALRRQGDLAAASASFRKAIELNQNFVEAHLNLGLTYKDRGHPETALITFLGALRVDSGHVETRRNLVAILQRDAELAYNPLLENELKTCFRTPYLEIRHLVHTTANQLKLKYDLVGRIQAKTEMDAGAFEEMCSDELFLLFLEKSRNVDPEMELILTIIRRNLLHSLSSAGGASEARRKFMAAIAQQTFNNEYVFLTGEEETARVADLKAEIERRMEAGERASEELERKLTAYGMYAPLYRLGCARALRDLPLEEWSAPFRPIVERTLFEPMEEEDIKGEIEAIGGIEDSVSRAVQSQYEENPYPRWISIASHNELDFFTYIQKLFPHFTPPGFLKGDIRMLIAGCGTGREPIFLAKLCPHIEVVAVDLSRTSLAYGMRMARKLGAGNIRFMQGDILNLSRLDRKFHVIVSSGVLHHMERPTEGLDVLLDLLVPNGLLRLGLYSEKARRTVVKAREKIQELGLRPVEKDIRLLRKKLLVEGELEELKSLLSSPDFYCMSNIRDLLFHVKEHRFTLSQIKKIMDERCLAFLGFSPSDRAILAYRERFPEDRTMTDLDSWDKFEEMYPDTFHAMYQFWCQKTGGAGAD